MNKLLLLLFIPIVCFGQEDIDTETKETISWLNNKLSTYSLKVDNISHNFVLSHIGIQKSDNGVFKQGTLYLYCAKETDIDEFELDYLVGLPILKINSIRFEEYPTNYHIIFNSVVNAKVIALKDLRDDNESLQLSDLHIFLSKSIDKEGLRPRMLKAFYYLFKLHGNDLNKTEKF
jgi:hypothetical protein